MNRQSAVWLARALWLLVALVSLGFMVVSFLPPPTAASASSNDALGGVLILVAVLVIESVSALAASAHPENPIGWILSVSALLMTLMIGASIYATLAAALPAAFPGGPAAAWFSSWNDRPWLLGAFAAVFLLFPNGRLLSRGWRPILGLIILATLGLVVLSFEPGRLTGFPTIDNPVAVHLPAAFYGVISLASFLLLLGALTAGAFSLILRFRHAGGEERQQLKWIASAAAFAATTWLAAPVIWNLPILSDSSLWPILFVLGTLSIPLSIGVAILRYRLWDIDVIVRRTLIYSVLSVLLALAYLGSVILLQQIFRGLTGEGSDLAIIISTLLIAALFAPLRRRVQEWIDRRFYRRKFDAAAVLASFAATVRDEVELERLREELLSVVEQTIQPAHESLWLGSVGPKKGPPNSSGSF